jgi:hypothetical protein
MPRHWWYDSYNTIHEGAGENVVIICEIPDHPTGDSYTPEQSKERGDWYARSAADAKLICEVMNAHFAANP